MIFEEFAPTTAQRLDALRRVRTRVLTLITALGGACAVVATQLM